MKLEIIDDQNSSLVSKQFLKDFTRFMKKALADRKILSATENKKLVIAFVSSKKIQNLNKTFLKKNRVTDVLSFSPSEKDSFGELALCEEKIQLQAKDHGLTVEEETAYLVLHGFLHLLGYQHEEDAQKAKVMYQIQDEIFTEWQAVFQKT